VEPGRAFPRRLQNPAQLRRPCLALCRQPVAVAVCVEAGLEVVGAAAESLQRFDRRRDGVRREGRLLDQSNGATASASQPAPRATADVDGNRLAGRELIVASVLFQQGFQGLHVARQPADDLLLVQLRSGRHLHHAIQADFSITGPAEQRDRFLHHVVAPQEKAPELRAAGLDLPGQDQFLLSRQERELAHLTQVQVEGIVWRTLRWACRTGLLPRRRRS